MRRAHWILASCLVLVATVSLSACGRSPDASGDVKPAMAEPAQEVAVARADPKRGREVFETLCATCHAGDAMKGQPYIVPVIANQRWRYIESAFAAYRSGERESILMQPIAAALSEADVRNVAAYLAGPQDNNPALQQALRVLPLTLGEKPKQVSELCGACHGEVGGGDTPEVPVTAGQSPAYLSQALHEYKSGKRGKDNIMRPIAAALSDADIETLAAYFGNQDMPFKVRRDPDPSFEVAVSPGPNDAAADRFSTAKDAIASIEMVDIPGGRFVMGDRKAESFVGGGPAREVTVTPFRLGKYEVTFDQYDAFARSVGKPLPDDQGWGRGNRPVINVTWTDIHEFIAWLRKETGRKFRLPSEAEWEYAAGANTTTAYYWGDEFDSERVNVYGTTSGRDQWVYTAPVGSFPPNPFGLYDMGANVWERVADCWNMTYVGAPADSKPWMKGDCDNHPIRGGGWNNVKRPIRTTGRALNPASIPSVAVGFRLAEDPA